MEEKYEDLANAIVLTAVKDYRDALKKLKKHPRNNAALYTKKEVERFFNSDWYKLLTNIDPVMLIKQLNKEAAS